MQSKINYKLVNVKTLQDLRQEGNYLHNADYTVPIKDENGQIALAQFESVTEGELKKELENKVFDLVNDNGLIRIVESVIQNNIILEKNALGQLVKKQMDLFFNNLSIFDELGIKNKKRSILLHSAPGCGKTLTISRAAKEYSQNKNACVLIWPSDKIEPESLKFFLAHSCDWSKIDKLVLVMEDIGGGNTDEGVHHNSVDAQLLNFLDGMDVIFEKPTFILATTNSPDSHLASLTSRPGRFDLVLKVEDLSDSEKLDFFKFFSKNFWNEDCEDVIEFASKFQICHIKEAVIRARLELTIAENSSFVDELLRASRDIKDWIDRQKEGRLATGVSKQKFGFDF